MDLTKLSIEELLAAEEQVSDEIRCLSFALFCTYNARDVEVLVELDEKFKFIALVNQMAHENTCLFQNMLGTVRYVETGITNRCHNVHNLIVADKFVLTDGVPVEGALVLSPRVGLHDWLGSVDIKSLYPSVIRALNISPEKFVGQFENGEADWRGIIDMDDLPHTLVDTNKEAATLTGAQWWLTLVDNQWSITGYGTVFDVSSGLGVVPEAITFWYGERTRLQAEKKRYQKLEKALRESTGIVIPPE